MSRHNRGSGTRGARNVLPRIGKLAGIRAARSICSKTRSKSARAKFSICFHLCNFNGNSLFLNVFQFKVDCQNLTSYFRIIVFVHQTRWSVRYKLWSMSYISFKIKIQLLQTRTVYFTYPSLSRKLAINRDQALISFKYSLEVTWKVIQLKLDATICDFIHRNSWYFHVILRRRKFMKFSDEISKMGENYDKSVTFNGFKVKPLTTEFQGMKLLAWNHILNQRVQFRLAWNIPYKFSTLAKIQHENQTSS